MPPPKKPRRTAERILEVSLELFNRFGEPNVSTTLISAELRISPGNLYYHYPAKDELINALFDRYERALNELLAAADSVTVNVKLLVPVLPSFWLTLLMLSVTPPSSFWIVPTPWPSAARNGTAGARPRDASSTPSCSRVPRSTRPTQPPPS